MNRNASPPQELVIPVIEEHLEIDKRVVETGHAVRVRKEVEEVPGKAREPVVTEKVTVERVPMGKLISEPAGVRHEGDVMVVPVVEERLVTHKQLVLVEEIRITRQRQVHEALAEVPLRRERVVVERFDPKTQQWRPEEDAGTPVPQPSNQKE